MTPQEFIAEHPEHRDGVMKATYAYNLPGPLEERVLPVHCFDSDSRDSVCQLCGRARWDDLPPQCQNNPVLLVECRGDLVEQTIQGEEVKYAALLERGKKQIPALIAKHGMSARTLAMLHHTHGYCPEVVSSITEVPAGLMHEYHDLMELERTRSRASREVIVVTAKTL